jgi:glycosyltransferase involved in cell wall biosynthesis
MPQRVIYYCADRYAQVAGLDADLVDGFERQLLERVDTVVATSLPLREALSHQHSNVHYLPHGVNFSLFHGALEQPTIPDVAQRFIGQPTVGFIGLLGEHIEIELLNSAAAELTDTQFLFVGPIEAGLSNLPALPNVHYLPAVPQNQLPGILAVMDVCTLPYAISQRNHFANPTKVREYLAAGRTVVATQQPGLEDILKSSSASLLIAETSAQYNAHLRIALDNASKLSTADREQIAAPMRAETWAARAAILGRLLD